MKILEIQCEILVTMFANTLIFTYNSPMISKNKINYDIEFLIRNNRSSYQFTPIFESIDSTNTYIKTNIDNLSNKTVIISKHQTNGRGRYERNFISNDDKGIYCSFLIKEEINENLLKHLNIKIACALHYAIKTTFNIDTQIKWPNDLIINQKKCAGILIETQTLDNKYSSIIIGFGLNIYKQEFDHSLKLIATTLEDYKDQNYNRNQLLIHFFNQLDQFLYHKDIIPYFKKHMIPLRSNVFMTLNNSKELVKILDLNDNGQLIIETKNNDVLTLFNEEISL